MFMLRYNVVITPYCLTKFIFLIMTTHKIAYKFFPNHHISFENTLAKQIICADKKYYFLSLRMEDQSKDIHSSK